MTRNDDIDSVILTERTVNIGDRQVRRVVRVQPTDGADISVTWDDDEGSVVISLEPDDLDQLCLWWLTKARAAYRAFVRDYHHDHANAPDPGDWIERTPDNLSIADTDAHKE